MTSNAQIVKLARNADAEAAVRVALSESAGAQPRPRRRTSAWRIKPICRSVQSEMATRADRWAVSESVTYSAVTHKPIATKNTSRRLSMRLTTMSSSRVVVAPAQTRTRHRVKLRRTVRKKTMLVAKAAAIASSAPSFQKVGVQIGHEGPSSVPDYAERQEPRPPRRGRAMTRSTRQIATSHRRSFRYHQSMLGPVRRAFFALVAGLAHAASAEPAPRLTPPNSFKPPSDVSVAVTVMHRHRAIQECAFKGTPPVCAGPELDADTSTTVRFEPVGVAKAAPNPSRSAVRLSFPRHTGGQERVIGLTAGEWLIDWPGAAAIAHIRVLAGAHPSVTLLTSSGRCRIQEDRCDLETHRVRRILTREDK